MEKKGKIIEAELVLLPEAIIQRIRSFLTKKETAQTSLLSKSWYDAWLTRPSLDFDPRGFPSVDSFWEFVKKTVQRYEKSNLNIESLKLWIPDNDNSVLVKELIIKGLKMGAIDLDFKINPPYIAFELPDEILGCENLNRVSVSGCVISTDNAIGNVRCSMLKSLCLDSVFLRGDVIWDIISRCPLIEELSLSRCQLFAFSSVFSVTSDNALELNPYVEFGKRFVGPILDGPLDSYQFRKLKCLLLCEVKLHPFFFDNMSSKFPCLEDLGLDECDSYRGALKISSPSLEYISIKRKQIEDQKLRAMFDVPNIRKFTFSGIRVPLLMFNTTSIWEESDLCISCDSVPRVDWFLWLNNQLTKLTFSRVYLSLGFLDNFDPLEKFRELPKSVVVEDITVDPPPPEVFPALFDVLLQCYRPVFVTQYLAPKSSASWNKNYGFIVFVFERLMQRVRQCDDLEQVNVEFYDEALSVWRPIITWEEGRLRCDYDDKRIRLHLKWTC